MARDPHAKVIPSVLDRLIDSEPNVAVEPHHSQRQSVRELKESLRRDLEWLLNTRRVPDEAPPSARELSRSVYQFGLPDFTSVPLKTETDKRRLSRILEVAVSNFEPRLTSVRISIPEMQGHGRVLRFQIEALLRVEPAPERIFFDAKLELATSQYRVEGETRAQ